MRHAAFLIVIVIAMCGCGGRAERPKPPGPVPPELEQALDDFGAVVRQEPPKPLKDFKVRPTQAGGYELWETVVGPMLGVEGVEKRLNPSQYAAFVLFLIDGEIGNGGFAQLYFNSDGSFAGEGPALLRGIGAFAQARVLERANRILGPSVPRSREARQRLLDGVDDPRFASLDSAWYEGEQLQDIVERFIRSRPRDFFA